MNDLSILIESNDQIELSMVRGLLDDASIPYFALGEITTLVNDVNPFLKKQIALQVPTDRLAEARELIENFTAADAQ